MIRKIQPEDKEMYIKMAEEFYCLDVVEKNVPKQHFELTFEELMKDSSYAGCLICQRENNICGYLLVAKTFSQEAGGICWWLEEMYVRPEFRKKGIANEMLDFVIKNKPHYVKRFRLEVEGYKAKLVSFYKSKGFSFLEYEQMKIDY